METKIAKVPVKWVMQGVLEIRYRHPAELEELIKNCNLPSGSMVSYEIDVEMIEQFNNREVSDHIEEAISEII